MLAGGEGLGGHHHDRHPGRQPGGTHRLQYGKTVHLRHHQVEDDGVRDVGLQVVEGVPAAGDGVDGEPFAAKGEAELDGGGLAVLDDQDARAVRLQGAGKPDPQAPEALHQFVQEGLPVVPPLGEYRAHPLGEPRRLLPGKVLGRDHHHRYGGGGLVGPELVDHGGAVHPRHHQVEGDQVGMVGQREFQRLLPVLGQEHVHAVFLEDRGDEDPVEFVVVHHQHQPAPLSGELRELLQELGPVHRFGDHADGTKRHPGLPVAGERDHDHRDVGRVAVPLQLAHDLPAVHLRHHDVQGDGEGTPGPGEANGVGPVQGGHRLVTGKGEARDDQRHRLRVVVHHQDAPAALAGRLCCGRHRQYRGLGRPTAREASVHRQPQGEDGTAAGLARHGDVTAEDLRALPRYGETESRPLVGAGGAAVRLPELLEDGVQEPGCDADAGVGDLHLELPVAPPKGDLDRTLGGELHRVPYQVLQDLPKLLPVHGHRRRGSGAALQGEGKPLVDSYRRQGVDRLPDDFLQGEPLVEDVLTPALDLRQVENVVDEGQQVLAVTLDDGEIPALVLGKPPSPLYGEHPRQGEHRVERRAQFVAHVGEELALQSGRLLQLLFLPVQHPVSAGELVRLVGEFGGLLQEFFGLLGELGVLHGEFGSELSHVLPGQHPGEPRTDGEPRLFQEVVAPRGEGAFRGERDEGPDLVVEGDRQRHDVGRHDLAEGGDQPEALPPLRDQVVGDLPEGEDHPELSLQGGAFEPAHAALVGADRVHRQELFPRFIVLEGDRHPGAGEFHQHREEPLEETGEVLRRHQALRDAGEPRLRRHLRLQCVGHGVEGGGELALFPGPLRGDAGPIVAGTDLPGGQGKVSDRQA